MSNKKWYIIEFENGCNSEIEASSVKEAYKITQTTMWLIGQPDNCRWDRSDGGGIFNILPRDE